MKTFHLKCHSPNTDYNNWKIVDVECDLADKGATRIKFISGLNQLIAHWCQMHYNIGHLEFDIWANRETLELLQFDEGCSLALNCGYTCHFRIPLIAGDADVFTVTQHCSTVDEMREKNEAIIEASVIYAHRQLLGSTDPFEMVKQQFKKLFFADMTTHCIWVGSVTIYQRSNDTWLVVVKHRTNDKTWHTQKVTVGLTKVTTEEVKKAIMTPSIGMTFKRAVPTMHDLPTDAQQGDICYVQDSKSMVVWCDTAWVHLKPTTGGQLKFPENTIFSRIRAVVISTKRYRDKPMGLFDAINRGLRSAHEVDQLKTVGYYAACPNDEGGYTISASFCVPADYAKFRKSVGMQLLWKSVNGICTHVEDDNLIRNDWAFMSYLQSKDFIYIFGRSLAEQEWRFTQRCNRYFKPKETAVDGDK